MPERADGADRPANVLVLAGPGGERIRYAKRHPFSYGAEGDEFVAGDDLVTVVVEGVRVSLAVCYDLRFADQFWAAGPEHRLLPGGRQLAVVAPGPLAGPARGPGHREPGLRGRREPGGHRRRRHEARGRQLHRRPLGVLVADAVEPDVETTLSADVDPAVVRATRERYPFLADRR